MSKVSFTGQHRVALNVCAAGALAALMSGCSSDATRLGDPFGNPFSTASNDQPKKRTHLASAHDVIPTGRTPPVTSMALAPRSTTVASLPAASAPYRAPISAETTGSIDRGPVRAAAGASFGGWSSSGGTPIQVAEGDSAEVLSKRYGVPETALLQVNGLHSAAEVRPGSQITIPIYSAAGVGAPARVAEAAPRPAVSQPKVEAPHMVRSDAKVAAVVPRQPAKAVAAAAPVKAGAKVKQVAAAGKVVPARTAAPAVASLQPHPLGKLPVAKVADAAPVAASKPVAAKAVVAKPLTAKAVAVQPVTAKPTKVAAAAPVPSVPAVAPPATAPAQTAVAAASAAPAVAAADTPEFRWPARGRIIQGFKGGGSNDGINIAVPEGTAVKAAEGGVVAYAGNELKGYGNLVLIRHPNGYVTAYANNGELDVKRGETVKRGQMIAKSGQSGNVSSPQLHFELRKGATPVDPTQYLAGL